MTPNLDAADKIQGWCSVPEMAWLQSQAASRMCILEIGSWKGRSSRAIADGLQNGAVLYCLDTFKGSEDETHGNGENAHAEAETVDIYAAFCENVADKIASGAVVPIKGDSRQVLLDTSFDMVFIDGCHSYEQTKHDILKWREHLKRGGLLCGHDYDSYPTHKGVIQAVDELYPDADKPCDRIWSTIKH